MSPSRALPEIVLNEDQSSHFSLQIAVGVNSLLGCHVSIKYKLRLFKALGQILFMSLLFRPTSPAWQKGLLSVAKVFSSISSFHIFFFLFLASHMTTFCSLNYCQDPHDSVLLCFQVPDEPILRMCRYSIG